MKIYTVQEMIEALQKFPKDAPIFTYNNNDEGDCPVEVIELCEKAYFPEEYEDQEEKEWFKKFHPNGMSPYYCKGDSAIEELWEKSGFQPVVIIRDKSFTECMEE
jgi:hypothetical protein